MTNSNLTTMNDLESSKTIKEFTVNQKKLEELKKHLTAIVDSETPNTSYISKLALFWGKMDSWKKITFGSLATLPLLIISLITAHAILLTISLFILAIFITTSTLLENHYGLIKDGDNGKKKLGEMADALSAVILSLNNLQVEFSKQLEYFQKENEEFAKLIQNFDELYEKKAELNNSLGKSDQELKQTNEKIAQLTELIRSKHQEQLTKYREHLKKVEEEFEQTKDKLIEQVTELTSTKDSLNQDVDHLRGLTEEFKETLINFAQKLTNDNDLTQEFRLKIEAFLKDKNKGFHLIMGQYDELDTKFSLLYEKYNLLYKEYETLLESDKSQQKRLERLNLYKIPENSLSQKLNQLGIYAHRPTTSAEEVGPRPNMAALGG